MKTKPTQPDVSVIIVNYHTSPLIDDCLDSLFNLTAGVSFEVIVVDNASENLSVSLRNASREEVRTLQLPENIGFGRANNEGAAIAGGRNLLFLNPDTVLLNNALEILSEFLERHPRCGACGGNLFDAALNPATSMKRFAPGLGWELNELLHLLPEKILYGRNRNFNHGERPLKVAYVTGADLMIRKELFDHLGGFAPEFFMYYEETDLCRRIRREGFRVCSVPQARIIHLEGKNRGFTMAPWKIRVLEESRSTYYRRNHSPLTIKTAQLIYTLFLCSRILLSSSRAKRSYYLRRLALSRTSPK